MPTTDELPAALERLKGTIAHDRECRRLLYLSSSCRCSAELLLLHAQRNDLIDFALAALNGDDLQAAAERLLEGLK